MTAPPWLPEVLRRTERLVAEAPSPLDRRLARVMDRIARANGGDSLASALLSPAATPFLRLLEAYREDAGLKGDGILTDIGEGTLLLYAEVRAQDDLVDEPGLVDRGDVYAVGFFAAAGAHAFARAVPDAAAFFGFRDQVLRAFAGAAAFELDVVRRRASAGAAVDWLGDKFLPLAVPLGAVAVAAGRAGDLDAIRRFVRALGLGLQLVNDALNVREDHVAGRWTPTLHWLYATGRIRPGDPPGPIHALLNSDAAMARTVEIARRAVFQALDVALAMGAPRLAAVTSERATFVESARARLLALSLGGGVR